MFTEQTIQAIWEKALSVEGYDKETVRKDACGAWIIRGHYGMRDSDFGWEIDHVYPVSLGGGDEPVNLRAMHWRNNAAKGDDFPVYNAEVQAEGGNNIDIVGQFTVNKGLKEKLEGLYKNK